MTPYASHFAIIVDETRGIMLNIMLRAGTSFYSQRNSRAHDQGCAQIWEACWSRSCGLGAFWEYFKLEESSSAIEIDSDVCPNGALNIDFFEYAPAKKV